MIFIKALGEEAVGRARSTRMRFKSFVYALSIVTELLDRQAEDLVSNAA